ncbi:MAG: MarR family winged helix-turn-helix transcriptional regulator [Candidatus Fournierella pullistercoris]|uniref:MarR family winged helix-turn-helix transcriptional regulator n=1 Tax=Candidatus Allofournierella pullistercoris TaxID=2838597 RepID=A0A948T2S7_9FIRM|nr:MarR family winged helix-turn-helix transcriptional regulator [Candidatus Fournierella pullistercoris]
MLEQAFSDVYSKFKLHFYQKVFARFQDREASLTTVETFCMEIIQALNKPTINEFASFVQISPPNAAYKVNSLIKKGYLKKVRSSSDRREYHLVITKKYEDYYNISYNYLSTVMNRIQERFSPAEVQKMGEMLTIISEELMPEVPLRLPHAGQLASEQGKG